MSESIYERGIEAEELVERVFRKHQWKTTPARHHRTGGGGAPLLRNDGSEIIMPDLHAVGHGASLWAEIKQKDRILDTRVRSQEEHGIDKLNWEHYRQLVHEAGVPVWLFIFEIPTGALLAGDISQLTPYPPIDKEKCKQYYGNVMTFVSREELTQVRLLPEHIPSEFEHDVDMRTGTLLPILLGIEADEP